MTEDDARLIAKAINDSKSDNSKIVDNLVKIAIAMLLMATTWIFSTVQDLKTNSAVFKTSADNNTVILSELKDDFERFTDKPRFAQDDFTQQIIPLRNQINANTIELNSDDGFEEKTDNRIQELELEVRILKSQILQNSTN